MTKIVVAGLSLLATKVIAPRRALALRVQPHEQQMSPQMYIVDGANKLRKVNRATVVCPGKAIKYLDGDIPNLRRVLETNKGWDAVLDLKYLNVLDLHGASYAFVSVRCTGQSDCVLIPVPAGNIRNQQGAWKAAAESAHFDEKSPEYNTSKAQRDRAVKNCTFTRHLEPSTISDLEVHSDSSIVFFSPPLSEPEWELDAEESDAEETKETKETKVAERAQSSGDEEEADPRQKHGRAVVIRQGRGAYEPHEDTIIGPVGKRIKCTFDEYLKLIGKGHRLMAERLTYKHATLCQGKDKEGIAGKCIYVSFLITDRPSANDKSYHHLHNMQKSAPCHCPTPPVIATDHSLCALRQRRRPHREDARTSRGGRRRFNPLPLFELGCGRPRKRQSACSRRYEAGQGRTHYIWYRQKGAATTEAWT